MPVTNFVLYIIVPALTLFPNSLAVPLQKEKWKTVQDTMSTEIEEASYTSARDADLLDSYNYAVMMLSPTLQTSTTQGLSHYLQKLGKFEVDTTVETGKYTPTAPNIALDENGKHSVSGFSKIKQAEPKLSPTEGTRTFRSFLMQPTEQPYNKEDISSLFPRTTADLQDGYSFDNEVEALMTPIIAVHKSDFSISDDESDNQIQKPELTGKKPEISEIRAYVDGKLVFVSEENQETMPKVSNDFYRLIGENYFADTTKKSLKNTNVELKRVDLDWWSNDQSAKKMEVSDNESGASAKESSLFSKTTFPDVLAGSSSVDVANENGEQSILSLGAYTSAESRQRLRSDVTSNSLVNQHLQFDPIPNGDPYEMNASGLADGVFVFTYLGEFLSFIQPYDFPVEFLRDVLWNRLSIVSLIFQSLRVEAGFVACVTIGVLLSLVIPSLVLAASCSSMCVPGKDVSETASLSSKNGVNRTRKSFVFGLFLVVLMIGTGVTAMLVTNEQLSSAMLRTPEVLTAALNDAASFVRNSNRQITHVTLSALDRTLGYLFADLEGVDELLGNPIKKQIAVETGVDVALDALVDVATVTNDLSKKVAELQETNLEMRRLTSEARNRLSDLTHQVDSFRRACPSRDKPVCETIDSSGLDITTRTDGLNTDSRLAILRSMAGGNLPQLAERVRSRFSDIPADIAQSTREIREGIKRELEGQQRRLIEAMWPMDNLARDLRARINGAKEIANSVEEGVADVEQWRWLSLLATTILVLLIWVLLASALIYSCCDREEKSRSLLISTLVLSSILSIGLWAVALSVLLVGGHGEVFICRPLYDKPDYKSLAELLDDPGVLYQPGGFFKNLLRSNQTLSAPIKTVLLECEDNKPAYEAFRLNSILDIESASNFKTWDNVFNQFNNLNGNFTQLNFLDPELQDKLQSLLQATAVNMTTHRLQISRPVTDKDLTSFAKQLENVANQIKDVSTASRVESLASRTRRLIDNSIKPIESKKEELVFQVTALEVQIAPLQRQVNQTISHLKTIQYYIDNQGGKIAELKAMEYSRRLANYLNQYRKQLMSSLNDNVAPCRPIFEIFHGLRHHICKQVMDPLNGYWFALVWSLMGLLIATPVSLNLIHYYGLRKTSLLCSNSSSVSSAERAVWSTPGTEENNDW